MNVLCVSQAFLPFVVVFGNEKRTFFSVVHEPNTNQPNNNLFITEQMLKLTGLSKKEIEAVAVVNGPGSFTGTRISVVNAKILSYALNVPLCAINSLDYIANHMHGDFIAALPAYRNEYFVARYKNNVRDSKDEIVNKDWLKAVEGTVVSTEETIGEFVRNFARVLINPETLLQLAISQITKNEIVKDPLSLCPVYLRSVDLLFRKTKHD